MTVKASSKNYSLTVSENSLLQEIAPMNVFALLAGLCRKYC